MSTNNIHGTAMLISLSVSQWSARKTDKKAAQEVAATHNVVKDKGAYYKSLVEGDELQAIKDLVTAARAEHYRRTLPWSDSGPRILSNVGYLDYMQEMGTFRNKFTSLVDQFVAAYPLMRQEAKRNLGTLFRDEDYPEVHEIAGKFGMSISVLPLPKGDDFRVQLGEQEEARIRAEVEANTRGAVDKALGDAYDRLAVVVESYLDRLKEPKTVFRDTMVGNAQALADILPSLNLTGDPRLTALTGKLKNLAATFQPDDLRKNPEARREAYNAALEMNKDVLDFFGGAL